MEIRVGHGIDTHKFAKGRKLILGGIEIPFEKGLLGHSDADALTHALIDALLGASGKDDIGTWFPDSDVKWKDADSCTMLIEVVTQLRKDGWSVVNVDANILTEKPKLKSYIPSMRKRLSDILEIAIDACAIKAGTTEGLGFTGREEGLMAQCVVLLKRN